ncbi:PAQR family membrane homeostasis protein TrhA [Pseudogracilibacillus sp. ICA-222130]|uniref:PAQR family membrane homeostasis protein TrhA n=1 Tax=Pseudogracilibacillus sp. ICA-222130 TaxID=3134655 RepID=UPI0030C03247
MEQINIFSKREEIANAITHGIGALLSVVALTLLIVYASMYGSAAHVVSFTIFGVTMLNLYVSSTLLHALPKGKAKDIFEILDHSSIYLFIAGTYTPITLIVMDGALGWVLFGIVWGVTVFGIVFKVFFVKKFLFVSTILYILLGWLVVIGWDQIISNLHGNGVTLLVIGGVLYTVGTIFFLWRGFKYHHAIWHLFVVGGSVFHFFAIFLYVLPL